MRNLSRAMLAAVLAVAAAPASAQMVLGEDESDLVIEAPMIAPGVLVDPMVPFDEELDEEDAAMIAADNGAVTIRDVDRRMNGDFEVDATGPDGDDFEMTIDGDTGEVIDIDG